jgi:hypothetical protein
MWSAVDIAQVLSAAFTALAAGAACWAVLEARTASRGQALITLLDDYSSAEMGNALRELAGWSRGHEGDEQTLISMLTAARETNQSEFQLIDDCRRRLHWFIKTAVLLRRNGTLDDATFKRAVIDSNGYQLWATVALPLTKQVEIRHRQRHHFDWADELVQEFPVP